MQYNNQNQKSLNKKNQNRKFKQFMQLFLST